MFMRRCCVARAQLGARTSKRFGRSAVLAKRAIEPLWNQKDCASGAVPPRENARPNGLVEWCLGRVTRKASDTSNGEFETD